MSKAVQTHSVSLVSKSLHQEQGYTVGNTNFAIWTLVQPGVTCPSYKWGQCHKLDKCHPKVMVSF